MKKILTFCICLLFTSIVCIGQDTPPNILLILTDQHSGSIMTQTGYPNIITPGIDKLADEGVSFTRSYVTYPVCTASRSSIMTGMMPSKLDNVTDFPAIGKTLADAGYETAYYGKWHVGSTSISGEENWHGFEDYQSSSDDTNISLLSRNFIKKTHDKPFFMVSSFMNPHDACELARNLSGGNEEYHDGDVGALTVDLNLCPPLPSNFAIPENEPEGYSGRRNQDPIDEYYSTNPYKLWTETEWRRYLYGYDRFLEKVDAHIEDVYDELGAQGLLENTIIIYTSDHGDGHGAHQWTQKKTFYEETINIPFVVSWKGKTKAGVVDKETLISSGVDLYPTLLKLAGIAIPESMIGADLSASFLQNSDEEMAVTRQYVVSEIDQKLYKTNTPGSFNGRMVVSKEFKYILFDKGANNEQLFDLVNDPGELYPITYDVEYNDDLLAHRDMLREWVENTNDNFDVDTNIYKQPIYTERLNNGQPIIYEEMFTDLGAAEKEGENINGPCVIRVPDWITPENRANPNAQYYCYFAHHSDQYIRMAWASEIEGPWHLYNIGSNVEIGDRGVLDNNNSDIILDNGLVIENNHLASPNVHVDDENQRIIMYFHSGSSTFVNGEEVNKQLSWVTTAPYGLNFYDGIEPVFLGASYFSVFEYDGNFYALDNGANIYRALDYNNPWTPSTSHDFTTNLWEKSPNTPFQDAITEETGLSFSDLRVRHANVRIVGDLLEVYYSRRGDLLEDIQMSTINLNVGDWTTWETSWPAANILQTAPGWEGGDITPEKSETSSAPEDVNQLRDPYVFTDIDGSSYLFYAGRGEDAIGIASLRRVNTKESDGIPSKPLELTAIAISPTEINLSWKDNTLIEEGYIVERKEEGGGFQEIASLSSNSIVYNDTDLSPDTTYTYRVFAYNTTGNSNYSVAISTATFNPDFKTLNYSTTEDAYVRGGDSADDNFGSDPLLVVKTGTNDQYFRKTLVKFDLTAENLENKIIGRAILRLYASKAKACTLTAIAIDDNWSESTVTWNTAPISGSDISSISISENEEYYEWDVTEYIEEQLSDDKIISISIDDLQADSETIEFNSKEATENLPELIINTVGDIDPSLSVSSLEGEKQLIGAYPNPVADVLNINITSSDINKLTIYSLKGESLYVKYDVTRNFQIDVKGFNNGLYLLRVDGTYGSQLIKFIIE